MKYKKTNNLSTQFTYTIKSFLYKKMNTKYNNIILYMNGNSIFWDGNVRAKFK